MLRFAGLSFALLFCFVSLTACEGDEDVNEVSCQSYIIGGDANATQGVPFENETLVQFLFSGAPPEASLQGLPKGLVFKDGLISGIPEESGDFDIVLSQVLPSECESLEVTPRATISVLENVTCVETSDCQLYFKALGRGDSCMINSECGADSLCAANPGGNFCLSDGSNEVCGEGTRQVDYVSAESSQLFGSVCLENVSRDFECKDVGGKKTCLPE